MKKKKIIKKKVLSKEAENFINFLWEWRILKYIPRASLHYLKGPAKENVAEHSFYTTIIGWMLAYLEGVDENKVIKMCLIHDLVEAREGDRNLINKFYSSTNELKIIEEITQDYHLKKFSLTKLFQEFSEEKTPEAKIAKDADILAGMLLEKECSDLGNQKAPKWLVFSTKRLKTKRAQEWGRLLIGTDPDAWWLKIVKRYILKKAI